MTRSVSLTDRSAWLGLPVSHIACLRHRGKGCEAIAVSDSGLQTVNGHLSGWLLMPLNWSVNETFLQLNTKKNCHLKYTTAAVMVAFIYGRQCQSSETRLLSAASQMTSSTAFGDFWIEETETLNQRTPAPHAIRVYSYGKCKAKSHFKCMTSDPWAL